LSVDLDAESVDVALPCPGAGGQPLLLRQAQLPGPLLRVRRWTAGIEVCGGARPVGARHPGAQRGQEAIPLRAQDAPVGSQRLEAVLQYGQLGAGEGCVPFPAAAVVEVRDDPLRDVGGSGERLLDPRPDPSRVADGFGCRVRFGGGHQLSTCRSTCPYGSTCSAVLCSFWKTAKKGQTHSQRPQEKIDPIRCAVWFGFDPRTMMALVSVWDSTRPPAPTS